MRTATPNDVYTQQGAKPACQEDTNAKFSHLLLAQLPRTQFTHSCQTYPEHSLHTASCQTRMPGRHQCKMFAPPIGTATPNDVYTQQAAKPACQEDPNAKLSHLLYWHSYTEHSLRTARRQTRMPGRHHHNMFASPIGRATPNDVYTQQRHLHTASCQTISRGSEYCACHTDRSRGPRRAGAPQPFLEAPSIAPATQTAAAAHGDQARRNLFWRL